MQRVALGATGITISSMGLGCSKLGSTLGGSSGSAAQRLIAAAIDGGVNFFDTANIYGQGESEHLLGKALSSCRHDVVIATKAGQHFSSSAKAISLVKKPISLMAMRFPALAQEIKRRRDKPLPRCFDPPYLQRELDNSLRRLGTDYIDVFYLHSPQPSHLRDNALAELMSSLKHAGKIRSWGISCDDDDDIGSILSLTSPEVLQIPFTKSLEHRKRCEDIKSKGGGIIARRIISQLGDDSEKINSKSARLTSAWTVALQTAHVTGALCGTTKIDHLLENIAAVNMAAAARLGLQERESAR